MGVAQAVHAVPGKTCQRFANMNTTERMSERWVRS